jgi:hypothetical protein
MAVPLAVPLQRGRAAAGIEGVACWGGGQAACRAEIFPGTHKCAIMR